MDYLLHSPETGDFSIECSDGTVLSVHASIMACRVAHFQLFLAHGWCREKAERRVALHFAAPVVAALVSWVYTDRICAEEADLGQLLEAASFFCMDELSQELQGEIFDNHLDETNLEYVIGLAEQLSCGTLYKLACSQRATIKVC
jgi:hypothetical protein